MILSRLSVRSFRNIESLTLDFSAGFNVFYGDNAQGKTNLLEAIFLIATMKSFRLAKNNELITWDHNCASIKGVVDSNPVMREIDLLLDGGAKKLRVDGKPVTRVADFFGILTVVLFAPEELSMIRSAPDVRRRYLDRAIFAGDLLYLARHHEYSKILKQRNSLLRTGDHSALHPWDDQLARAGAQLVTLRTRYIEKIAHILMDTYRDITGTSDEAGIQYHSVHRASSTDLFENTAALSAAMTRLREQELHQRATLAGPHRDDIAFTLNGKPLRHAASQGQQRCFVLALKMAEIEFIHRCYDRLPVLLMDDMTSELDRKRAERLYRFLNERGMQVFITTTGLEQAGMCAAGNDLRTFHVKQGAVHGSFAGTSEGILS